MMASLADVVTGLAAVVVAILGMVGFLTLFGSRR